MNPIDVPPVNTHNKEQKGQLGNRYAILIVDGNEFFRKTMKYLLKDHIDNIEIHEARTVPEALDLVRRNSPMMILTDIHLPGESGLNLARQVKQSSPGTIIIICSTSYAREYQKAAYQNGADYYASKIATTPKKIYQMVEAFIEKGANPVHRLP